MSLHDKTVELLRTLKPKELSYSNETSQVTAKFDSLEVSAEAFMMTTRELDVCAVHSSKNFEVKVFV